MNDYRATVNLPGQPLGTVRSHPDSPRTAVLVGQGILVPVEKALTEPFDDGVVDDPAAAAALAPAVGATELPAERPSAPRKPRPPAKAKGDAPEAADAG